MSRTIASRGSVAALLLALPLLAGCPDPAPSGPGGGASSGTTGSTNPPGVGAAPGGTVPVEGH